MRKQAQRAQSRLHLRMLDEAYDKPAWHGPNLRSALRGVRAKQAAWRHNIWEIVVHAAYWKYVVRRRLRRAFPYKGSNWFARPAGARSEKAWRRDVALLAQVHRALRATVAGLGSKVSNANLIYGIACHDVYHAGQIRLLRRLQTKS